MDCLKPNSCYLLITFGVVVAIIVLIFAFFYFKPLLGLKSKPTPLETTSQAISPQEESKVSLGDLKVTVPKNAARAMGKMEVSRISAKQAPAAEKENKVVGDVYQIESSTQIASEKPATLTLSYNLAEVLEGTTEENLYLATYKDKNWEPVVGSTIDSQNKTISASVDHFSFFAVFAYYGEVLQEILQSDKIEAKTRFADLPDGIKQELSANYSQASIKSGLYWRLSFKSRTSLGTILAANFINYVNGAVISVLEGGKEKAADWVAEELLKKLGHGILAEQTSARTADFSVVLYDAAKVGVKIANKGFKVAAKAAEIQVHVSSWVLETEMAYINNNLNEAYKKLIGISLWTGRKPLEVYVIGIDGENNLTGRLDKGLKFYYFDHNENKYVNYYDDIVAKAVEDVRLEEEPKPTPLPIPIPKPVASVIPIPTPISSAPPSPTTAASGGCQKVDLSKDYQTYYYTDETYSCGTYDKNVTAGKAAFRCKDGGTPRWRYHYVRTVETNGAAKLKIKGLVGLTDFSKFFVESGGIGVKYDDYVDLVVLKEDPTSTLVGECNRTYNQGTGNKCAIQNNHPTSLGHCGVPKYRASNNCDFEINTSGLQKVYLVLRIADAWPNDMDGSVSSLEVCPQ